MKNNRFTFKSRCKSFKHAFNGIKILFIQEQNFKIHVIATVLVLFFAIILDVSLLNWILLLFSIVIVVVSEIFNSSIEKLCDLYSIEENKNIKKIKDISAAAVLIASIIAAIVGLLVFIPYFLVFVEKLLIK